MVTARGVPFLTVIVALLVVFSPLLLWMVWAYVVVSALSSV